MASGSRVFVSKGRPATDVSAWSLLANFVDRADIRMVQCGCGVCLVAKTFECLRVFRNVIKFQCNETAKLRVFGLINHAHATGTKRFDDPVVRNGLVNERVGARHSPVILGCDIS